MSRTTEQLFAELKKLAPSVTFTTSKFHDDDEVWDGDTSINPEEDGLEPFVIETIAKTIIGGEEIEETAHLSGSWMDSDEPIGDMGGYLPQKLEEAAQELLWRVKEYGDSPAAANVVSQLHAVFACLTAEMHARYDEQMAGKSV